MLEADFYTARCVVRTTQTTTQVDHPFEAQSASQKGITMPHDPLLETSEVARILSVSAPTVIEYSRTGQLKATFFGRRWRYRPDDVQAFIDSHMRGR